LALLGFASSAPLWADEPAAQETGKKAADADLDKKLEVGSPDKWTFELTSYVWMAGLDGSATLGPVSGDVHQDFTDILKKLDGGFMGHVEARKGRIGGWFDGMYMKLGSDEPVGPLTLDVSDKMGIMDFGGYYRFGQRAHFDAMLGGRMVISDTDASLTGPNATTVSRSLNKTWAEPLIGARLSGPFGDTSKWFWSLRLDLSGFGVGSDMTLNNTDVIGYQFNDRYALGFGVRYLRIDYSHGSNELILNMFGPIVGFQTRF
jgi:hypothetical protein